MFNIHTDQFSNERAEVLLIYKKSRFDLYFKERKNAHYQKLEEEGHAQIEALRSAHEENQKTIEFVKAVLKRKNANVRVRYRARVTREDTEGRLVITVGGDGTLLDAASKVLHSPILGVNSDTDRSVGFLCAADRDNFEDIFDSIVARRLKPTKITRLQARLNGEVLRPVLNEVLVAHKNPAATSRFILTFSGQKAVFKSSGIWVSTAVGSTAAIRSADGEIQILEDERLQVLVREAYWPTKVGSDLEHFFVGKDHEVVLESTMREGALYLDGPHRRFKFPTGAQLILSGNGPTLHLFATEEMAERRKAILT